MFTLRIIHQHGEEQNYYLGNSYKLTLKENAPSTFKFYEESILQTCTDSESIYGFIISEITDIINLSITNSYYIVNENGKTYQNLTYVRPRPSK